MLPAPADMRGDLLLTGTLLPAPPVVSAPRVKQLYRQEGPLFLFLFVAHEPPPTVPARGTSRRHLPHTVQQSYTVREGRLGDGKSGHGTHPGQPTVAWTLLARRRGRVGYQYPIRAVVMAVSVALNGVVTGDWLIWCSG